MNPTPADETSGDFLKDALARHQAPLLRYATRLLSDPDRAQDVVQDTFVKLLARQATAGDDHVAEWLFTVCRHRAFDVLRKEGRMKRFAEGQAEAVPAADPRPGSALEQAETQAALRRLIDRLPPNQQEVVRLKFQNGFSYKEISRITELSISNVGFLIHTAVRRLREDGAAQQL